MEKFRYNISCAIYQGKEYFLNSNSSFEKDMLFLESLDKTDEKLGFKKKYDKYMRHNTYVKQVKAKDLDSYYMYGQYAVYNGFYCCISWEEPFHFYLDGKVLIYIPDGGTYIDIKDELASRDYCDSKTGLQYKTATHRTCTPEEFKEAGLTLDNPRDWEIRTYCAAVDFKDIFIIQRKYPVSYDRKKMKGKGWFLQHVKHVWRKQYFDKTKEFKDPTRITYEEKTDPVFDYHAVVKKEGETLEDLYRQKRVDHFAAYYCRAGGLALDSYIDKALHALADKYLWD